MLRAKLRRVAAVVFAWAAAGLLLGTYDELLRETLGVELVGYDVGRALAMKTFGTALGGLFAAPIVVLLFKGPLRGKRFSLVVLAESVLFAGTAIVVTSLFDRFVPGARFASLDDSLTSPFTLRWILFAAVLGGVTSFALEIHDRIGQGAFLGFLLGRYHQARHEVRCFMFLDLAGSTAHAQRLGSEKYYRLLNAFFADVTDAILDTQGEIYQYVGDEIVVSWKSSAGLERANCVRCFRLIRQTVEARSERYLRDFGEVPKFRAAFHIGEITVGEIGVLKRERVFTGDTLNTAARIEERCAKLGLSTLLSGDLLSALPAEHPFLPRHIEDIQLRGRREATALFTVDPEGPAQNGDASNVK